MSKLRSQYSLVLSLVAAATLLVDQISKQIVLANVVPSESTRIIGDFLRLTLVYNEGGAFSTHLGPSLFYTVVSIVIVAAVIAFLYRHAGREPVIDFSLAAIVGGALGNLLDRFRFGSVVDWIDVDFFDIHIPAASLLLFDFGGYNLARWPVFNAADAAVTVAVAAIVIRLLIKRKHLGYAEETADS